MSDWKAPDVAVDFDRSPRERWERERRQSRSEQWAIRATIPDRGRVRVELEAVPEDLAPLLRRVRDEVDVSRFHFPVVFRLKVCGPVLEMFCLTVVPDLSSTDGKGEFTSHVVNEIPLDQLRYADDAFDVVVGRLLKLLEKRMEHEVHEAFWVGGRRLVNDHELWGGPLNVPLPGERTAR